MSSKRTTALAALILSAGTGAATQVPPLPAAAQTVPMLQEIVVTQAFEARVDEYVVLHRLLEGPQPPLRMTRDISTVQASMRELALRIQLARVNARQGDLIAPDVARMFRRRIVACLPPEQWAAILADNAEEEEDVRIGPPPALHVNMEWPEKVLFEFVPAVPRRGAGGRVRQVSCVCSTRPGIQEASFHDSTPRRHRPRRARNQRALRPRHRSRRPEFAEDGNCPPTSRNVSSRSRDAR